MASKALQLEAVDRMLGVAGRQAGGGGPSDVRRLGTAGATRLGVAAEGPSAAMRILRRPVTVGARPDGGAEVVAGRRWGYGLSEFRLVDRMLELAVDQIVPPVRHDLASG